MSHRHTPRSRFGGNKSNKSSSKKEGSLLGLAHVTRFNYRGSHKSGSALDPNSARRSMNIPEEREDEEGNTSRSLMIDMSFGNQLNEILGHGEYLLLMLSITGIYFLVAGMQYWTPTYIITVL